MLEFFIACISISWPAIKIDSTQYRTHTGQEETPCIELRVEVGVPERERLAKNDSNDFCYQVFLLASPRLASPFVLFLLGAHILQFCRRCFSFWAVKSMLHNLSTGTVDYDCQRIVFNALKLKLDSSLAPAQKSMQASICTWLRLWPKNWHISASNRACERWLMPTGITNLCPASVGEEGTAGKRNFSSAPKLIEVFEWCQECRLIAGGEM